MSARTDFVQYFLCNELLHTIYNFLPLPFLRLSGRKASTDTTPRLLIQSLAENAQKLDLDQESFEQILTEHVNALASGQDPEPELESFLIAYSDKLESRIREIPNSPDKAREALLALVDLEAFLDTDQVYDAMVLLDREILPEVIAGVVKSWKAAARKHKAVHKRSSSESSIFWVSLDFRDTIDGLSRYRFREHFDIGEFELAFGEVESVLATSLLEGSSGLRAMMTSLWGDHDLTSVAYDLWLISRSQNLVNRVRDFVNIALRRISGWQFPEGWWTDFQLTEPLGKDPETGREVVERLPSTYTTALCSLNLVKLAASERLRQKGAIGARWLLDKQNPDGSWSREEMSPGGVTAKPDLFLTLLALEAIARSGIQNVTHSFDLGIEWVMSQQNDLGMWDDEGFPFPFMTVLVLEFLATKDNFPRQLDPFLSMSRDFLNKSVQLSSEDNGNSHRLAVIAAFQGIEAFLYSVLSHPDVNCKIFEKPNETIGMRRALTQFQGYLQDKGDINRNEIIPYRNSLDRLAYLRDQVVHKGVDVTQAMCRPVVGDALRFAQKYALEVFRYNPWA